MPDLIPTDLPATIIWSNLIGLLLVPLVWWQFRASKSKTEFLIANFAAALVFTTSFWLAGAHTAALVSLAAGVTGLGQALLDRHHWWARGGLALISIGTALWIAPPVAFFGWVAAFAYAWVRFAEAQHENIMRVMYVISPMLWILIAAESGALTLVPVDAFSLYLAIRWVADRLPRERETSNNTVADQS